MESDSSASLAFVLFILCNCLSCSVRERKASCLTDALYGVNSGAANGMVSSVQSFPLILLAVLSSRYDLLL